MDYGIIAYENQMDSGTWSCKVSTSLPGTGIIKNLPDHTSIYV